MVKEVNCGLSAVGATYDDFLGSCVHCVQIAVKSSVIANKLLSRNNRVRKVERKLVLVERSFFNSKTLQPVRGIPSKVPGKDSRIARNRAGCVSEVVRVGVQRQGSAEEDEEEASNLDRNNLVKQEGILDGLAGGVDDENVVFFDITILVNVHLFDVFVALHIGEAAGAVAFIALVHSDK